MLYIIKEKTSSETLKYNIISNTMPADRRAISNDNLLQMRDKKAQPTENIYYVMRNIS